MVSRIQLATRAQWGFLSFEEVELVIEVPVTADKLAGELIWDVPRQLSSSPDIGEKCVGHPTFAGVGPATLPTVPDGFFNIVECFSKVLLSYCEDRSYLVRQSPDCLVCSNQLFYLQVYRKLGSHHLQCIARNCPIRPGLP